MSLYIFSSYYYQAVTSLSYIVYTYYAFEQKNIFFAELLENWIDGDEYFC